MIKKYIVLFSISILSGQNLLDEYFNNPDGLPGGWQFIPESYPTNTGQWLINNWAGAFNINAPSASYYWSPSVSNSFAYPYEGHYLYSPVMNVESETNVIVRFQIALDGYQSPTGHTMV